MKLALLNTSIATQDGNYELWPITREQAIEFLEASIAADGFVSHIGHQATADILSCLLGHTIPMSRVPLAQQQSQGAIVLKLGKDGQMFRAEEGRIYTIEEMEEIGYSLKLLVRLPDVCAQPVKLRDLFSL